MSRRGALALAGTAAAAAALGPALASLGAVRRALTPTVLPGLLSGASHTTHVALTFDDGPDPASTPSFLDLLDRHCTRATFFLLGRHAAEHPDLVRRTVESGHEVAVHGWDHRCVALMPPGRLARDLRRARAVLEDLTGVPPRWYRPPYGVLTTEALLVARAQGLTTVLWTDWGRDWDHGATPDRIVGHVSRRLRPGGTVLLHDTDRTSAPGSWRRTLPATDRLLATWRAAGVPVGPLREHWRPVTADRPVARPRTAPY